MSLLVSLCLGGVPRNVRQACNGTKVADCNAGIEFSGGGLRLGTPKGHFLASLFDRRADYEVYASRRQKTHEGKLPKVTILPGRLVSNEPLQAAITSTSRQA
jgi:hypothetical protein